MTNTKKRLDVLLAERGLCESREKARGLILSGLVSVNGSRADKVGHAFPVDALIEITVPEHAYVSRGGLKLDKALRDLKVSVLDKVVLDVGASTGGFTDCALQNGATHVIAVDVGSGQLAWKLRTDTRVTVMEKTNARYLTKDMLSLTPELATVDVAFISLKLIFPMLMQVLPPHGEVIALIKPQFEAGKEVVSRGRGVVRDRNVHESVILEIVKAAEALNWALQGLTFSPITGPEGNIEFIGWWRMTGDAIITPIISELVAVAHKELSSK